MQSALSAPHLINEEAAFAYVEAKLWPHGATCPHCGVIGEASRSQGKTTRAGLWNCRACRKPFTVRMGTIFESSHVPLHIWLQAIYLICSSKKGVSTRQIQRTFGGSMKTAWFLMHRIREAMADGALEPFGGGGGDVEADETYIGRDPDEPNSSHQWSKMKVMSIIDRTSGQARSIVLDFVTTKTVTDAIVAHVSPEARLLTDQAPQYLKVGRQLADHQSVNHRRREYVRKGDVTVHTNTVEGYFSVFKRGMRGVYQHCSKKHLHRYMAEFDFRYSNRSAVFVEDAQRADNALKGFAGKRLTYETVSARRSSEEARIVW